MMDLSIDAYTQAQQIQLTVLELMELPLKEKSTILSWKMATLKCSTKDNLKYNFDRTN